MVEETLGTTEEYQRPHWRTYYFIAFMFFCWLNAVHMQSDLLQYDMYHFGQEIMMLSNS